MKKLYSLRMFTQKTSTTQIFFLVWLQSDNELLISEMQKIGGVTEFVFEIKHMENYPNFDTSVLVTRHELVFTDQVNILALDFYGRRV